MTYEESCDIKDITHLCLLRKYIAYNGILIPPPTEQTRGEDVDRAILEFLTKNEVDTKSFATDGTQKLYVKIKVFLFVPHFQKGDIRMFHCIICQEAMDSVVKISNQKH